MKDQIEQQATAIRSLRRALQDLSKASQAAAYHLDYAARLTADLNMPHLSGNFAAAGKALAGQILMADLTTALRGLPVMMVCTTCGRSDVAGIESCGLPICATETMSAA